jgi:hypothetical protein
MCTSLAIHDSFSELPIWEIPPTMMNIISNRVITYMQPYQPCIILAKLNNKTCIVAYNGYIGYAVTECLTQVT